MKSISKLWTLVGVILFFLYDVTAINAGKEKSKHVFVGSSSRSKKQETELEYHLVTSQTSSRKPGRNQKHLSLSSNKKRKFQKASDHSGNVKINSKKQKLSEPFQRNLEIDFGLEKLQGERESRQHKMYHRHFLEDMDQVRWPHGTENRDQIIHLRDQSKEKEDTARRQALASKLFGKTNNVISDVLEGQSVKSSQTAHDLKNQYEHLGKTSKINEDLVPTHRAQEKVLQTKEINELVNAEKSVQCFYCRHGDYIIAKLHHQQMKGKQSPEISIEPHKDPAGKGQ